ncbi:Protein CBG13557 [Caenorhabditis briggsae]|uniref:Protein CBG13557 n=2 Tax=Caenorhabditis briggsae TaxID=6238 RepID=A8XI64_CAEBR|nr:Protein CBG13557 [Caenorhabditis briggsae]ULT98194.1 hypothetical protein L3Y34_005776 [Caenorhabditis briggsae]CAP32338.1 Protein CBG13557 [Caenorhabditis briggsae]
MISQLILVSLMISSAVADCQYPDRLIDGLCFTFVDIPKTFWEADEWCSYKAPNAWSYLALEENDIHAIWLAKTAELMFTSKYFWIGVYRPTANDNFRTILNRYLTYEHFGQINPSMNYAAGRTSDGKWVTLPQEQKLPFICSYKPTVEALKRRLP